MTRMSRSGLMAAVLAVGMARATRADAKPEGGPLKMVAHVNVPEPGTRGAGLKNVANLLQEISVLKPA